MEWTKAQQKIIDARNCNLLVSAAAGSGKTAVLVERIIQMISDKAHPMNVDELLVVTFTKAAASQMKDKIRSAMEKLIKENPGNQHFQDQLHLLNQANILTIDSFCYKVVKEHFYAVGIEPGIRVGETGELALLKKEIMGTVIEKHYENDKNFAAFSEAYCADKNDEKLEDFIGDVYEISSSYPRPEVWIEDAKQDLKVSSEEMFLNMAYVKRYFAEIHDIAAQIKLQVLDCLELARGIDGPLYMEKALLSDIVLVDDIIGANTYSMFYELGKVKFANIGRGKDGTYNKDIADTIKNNRNRYKEEIKNLLKAFALPFDKVLSQMQEQSGMLTALLNVVEEFQKEFLAAKLEKNILEFSDVEHFALEILCDKYDEHNMPVPSRIGCEIAEDFYEIMIDEYQDSNYLQEAILNCVSKVSQGQNNIFMVGDVKQSIYSFRMARPDLFMAKYDTYGEDGNAKERKLLLKNNFRSRANVLQGINYIFYQIMGRDLGGIDYTEEEVLVPSKEFLPYDTDCVELLIGESKNFDAVCQDKENNKEAVVFAQKEEDLDENLEDIGKKELEATMIANKIDALFGKHGEPVYQVMDEAKGVLRNITYKDIVILLRAPSGFGDIFSEIFMNRGIPVRVQNEAGYLDTVEVHQVLSFIRTLDNPYNEVELVAALRGYFGRMSEEELTELVLAKRCMEQRMHKNIHLYDMLLWLCDRKRCGENEELNNLQIQNEGLYRKCCAFMETLEELKEQNRYMSISQLIQWIYDNKNYYYYVQSMPEGRQRTRNMDLFMEEILHYERSSFHGLFEFLQYIDEVIDNKISLGGDPSLDCDEDVVRIMSIHKSKGLEFPVVFVAGMGKQFNLVDTKEALIVHSDYHLGAKYVNVEKRYGNDSFARQAFSALIKTDSIAEELRIFYVALTRAKEKLIMTGVVPDIPKQVHKYEAVGKMKDLKIGFSNVHRANTYMDFVIAAFIRNRQFYDAMIQVQPRMDLKNESMITGAYECSNFIENPGFDMNVAIYNYQKIAVEHIEKKMEDNQGRIHQIKEWKNGNAGTGEKYEKHFGFVYRNEELTKQKSKLSVTEIKRIYEQDEFTILDSTKKGFSDKIPVPNFVMKERVLDAAQKGTFAHKAMEIFDFKSIDTREKIVDWMNHITKEKRLGVDIENILTVDNIYALVCSDLGRRMIRADRNGKLYKERKFVVGVPADKITKRNRECSDREQMVVVQGIIDAYFEEDDNIILIDYKTDLVKPGMEEELIKRYQTQLQYYKDTLEQLLGKEVKETYLYSFALNKAIPM